MTRRRPLLVSIGSAAVLAGCAAPPSRTPDEDDDTDDIPTDREVRDPDEREPWEREADERIVDHRTTSLEVVTSDSGGDPISDVAIDVSMQRHAFEFGTAVAEPRVVEDRSDDDPYWSALETLFNAAVLEERHKWNSWETENERELAEEATRRLLESGLDVRGHTVIWQHFGHDIIPEDVQSVMEGNAENGEYLADRTAGHVENIVSHYDGELVDWDLINEHLDHHAITESISPENPPQEAPALVDWFEVADAVSPDTPLFVNDYDIIVGDNEERRAEMDTLIGYLRWADAPVDGVGFQAHYDDADHAADGDELYELFERYGDGFDVDLRVTEYDTFGEGWTEEMEATNLYVVLKTAFSHPATVGFHMWGFWDGEHWEDNAPLFREDWSEKPGYDVYTDLVFDEWWTDESGATDEDGLYETLAFLGEYEVVVEGPDEETVTESVSLTDPTSTERLEVELDVD